VIRARRTRIVATVGPASDTPTQLDALITAGTDVFRISASHDPIDVVRARVAAVRAAAERTGTEVAVMVDLAGPKMRCIPPSETVELVENRTWKIKSGPPGSDRDTLGSTIPSEAWANIPIGTVIAIGDGALQFAVLAWDGDSAICSALASGTLRGRPGLHIPSNLLPMESPTIEDIEVVKACVEIGVDAIAVSFVRTAADVQRVKNLAPDCLVVAKIETALAVNDLEAVIAAADAVMVARGDLGLEFPLSEIPFLQNRIIRASTAAARPVITATQMLESMVQAKVPTRAEAADVANAILDGTSAVMLSGETAIGVDPVAAVRTMAEFAARADQDVAPRTELPLPLTGNSNTAPVTHAVSEAAHRVAYQTGAVAVVGLTDSGFTARALSRWRSPLPLIAATRSERTIRQLRFSWGVTAVRVHSAEADDVLVELVGAGVLPPDAPVVVVSGVPGGRASDTVRVRRTPTSA
jgi:pyruvate kinase